MKTRSRNGGCSRLVRALRFKPQVAPLVLATLLLAAIPRPAWCGPVGTVFLEDGVAGSPDYQSLTHTGPTPFDVRLDVVTSDVQGIATGVQMPQRSLLGSFSAAHFAANVNPTPFPLHATTTVSNQTMWIATSSSGTVSGSIVGVDVGILFDGVLRHEIIAGFSSGSPPPNPVPPDVGDLTASVLVEVDVAGIGTVLRLGAAYDFARHSEGLTPELIGSLTASDVTVSSDFANNVVYQAEVDFFNIFPDLFTVPLGTPFTLDESMMTDAFLQYGGFGEQTLTSDFGHTFSLELSTSASGVTIQRFNQPAAVPEPSSLMLLGMGAIGLLGCACRRRRKTVAGSDY